MITSPSTAGRNRILHPELCSLWEMEGIMSNNCSEFLITRFPFPSPCLIRRALPATTSLNLALLLCPGAQPCHGFGSSIQHLHFSCEFGLGSSELPDHSPDLAFCCASLPDPAQAAVLSLIAKLMCSCRASQTKPRSQSWLLILLPCARARQTPEDERATVTSPLSHICGS